MWLGAVFVAVPDLFRAHCMALNAKGGAAPMRGKHFGYRTTVFQQASPRAKGAPQRFTKLAHCCAKTRVGLH